MSYHDIRSGDDMNSTLFTARDNFKDHLDFLKRQNYNVVPLSDVVDWIRNGTPLPERAIALTFDDNYIGNYEHAYPLLAEREMYMTIFVIPNSVGNMSGWGYCSWDMLREMSASGWISVQSHTMTHPNLPTLTVSEMQYELAQSKAEIELEVAACPFIAYPYTAYDSTVITECINAGYEAGFRGSGPNYGSEAMFEINRSFGAITATLEEFKNIIGFTGSDPDGPVIVDNGDLGFNTSGLWATASDGFQYYYNNYRYCATNVTGGSFVRFTPTIPETRLYDVYAWWTAGDTRNPQTEYTIHVASGGEITVQVDQQINGGKWNYLGTYTLEAGSNNHVLLSNKGPGGYSVSADSIKCMPTAASISGWEFY